VVILLLAGSTIAYAHYSERVESYIAAYLISGLIVLSALALLIWFAAFSGFNIRTARSGSGVSSRSLRSLQSPSNR